MKRFRQFLAFLTHLRMHRNRLITFFAVLLLVTACGRSPGADSTWSRIDGASFAAELAVPRPDSARPQIIVDVREPELFAAGHIPGAINMPWPSAKSRAPEELNPAQDIVLVCHGGPMGDELAEILEARGFTSVRNLAGGMNAWRGPTEPAR